MDRRGRVERLLQPSRLRRKADVTRPRVCRHLYEADGKPSSKVVPQMQAHLSLRRGRVRFFVPQWQTDGNKREK